MPPTSYDVIVIGAGAAGLFCAIEAGKRGRRVLVLDKAKSVGEKIRISGGGRCNFTNIHASPKHYLSENSHFCVSALRRYTAADFVRLVETHGIAYHEKTLGQLFCDGSSKQIIRMLLDECDAANVKIYTECHVQAVSKQDEQFSVMVQGTGTLTADSLVIATGGPSIPKMGATGWGYDVAKQFGLPVVPTRAALVPFTLDAGMLNRIKPLAGVAADVEVICNGMRFKEAMLFTHRGLSGPAMLQISSYWQEGDGICVNLLPEMDAFDALKTLRQNNPKQEPHTVLAQWLPKRMAQYLCELHGWRGRLADMGNVQLEAMAGHLHGWEIYPNGTEGYRTAEVTLGGVDTDALSSKTMESKHVPGLYFIGEVVDVTGHLGGFNFQWAWSSGWAAGQYV